MIISFNDKSLFCYLDIICFDKSNNFLVASDGFSLPNIADITHIPSTPVPFNSNALSMLIPPIATTGIDTSSLISFNYAIVNEVASFLVSVWNIAPTPI